MPRVWRRCAGMACAARTDTWFFQTLQHTLGWPPAQWRQLDSAHNKRNVAEYEGYLEVENSQVEALMHLVSQLLTDTRALVDSPKI